MNQRIVATKEIFTFKATQRFVTVYPRVYWSITGEEMKCSLKKPCGTNVSHQFLFAVLVVSTSSGFHQNHELISTALHARLLQKRIHPACRFL